MGGDRVDRVWWVWVVEKKSVGLAGLETVKHPDARHDAVEGRRGERVVVEERVIGGTRWWWSWSSSSSSSSLRVGGGGGVVGY